MSDQATGRIKIRRMKAGFFERDRLRSYVVMIDERPSGTLRRGKEIVLDVPPGPHEVRIKIDWTGSPRVSVEVKAGEQVDLVAIPKGVTPAPIADMIGNDRWVTLRQE